MTKAKQQIIEATGDLIGAQGYHATGLNEIIRESGAPKGSLYYYFPGGKEQLAAEAVRQAGEEVEARIRGELARTADPAKAVRRFILALSRYVAASGYRAGGPITTVALESATTADQLNEACRDVYAGWQEAFAEKLAGSGLAPYRAERLASVIIAGLEGAIVLSRTRHSPAPLVDLAEELALWLRAATRGHP